MVLEFQTRRRRALARAGAPQPDLPQSSLPNWIAQAKEQFAHKGTRFEFAKLFSNLVFDRVRSMPQGAASTPVAGLDAMEAEASGQDGFDKVSRKETLQQEKLESIIFEAKEIDVPALEEYLQDLFSSKDAKEALSTMRSRIRYFANSLRSKDIEADDVKQVISSVLQTDVLSDKKQTLLKQFEKNPVVVQELASVLTMQLASIQTWSWSSEGVTVPVEHFLSCSLI